MKNLFLAFTIIFGACSTLFSQYATINFDEDMRCFNSHEPLPAEKQLMLNGIIKSDINLVEVTIHTSKGAENREALYTNNWERKTSDTGNGYKIPINYKLRGGKTYDFTISYYKSLTETESVALYESLSSAMNSYIDQNFELKNKKIGLELKSKKMLNEMNEIVNSGLQYFRSTQLDRFDGFSTLVKGQIEKIEDAKLGKANVILLQDDKKAARGNYRTQLVDNLKALVNNELKFVLNADWNALEKEYNLDNYETESKSGYFAVNVGYGAVSLGKEIENLSYGASPYIGLSFPLSTSTIVPKFFRNASVTVGVFTQDFMDEVAQREITGPVIKKPFYLGLDYKLFQFIRFNAGATFLEEISSSTGQINNIQDRVFVEPFIGISAKINLTVGLDK